MFSFIFEITKYANLQLFQYRILGTNKSFYRIHKKVFFTNNDERLDGCFWDCEIIFDIIHGVFKNTHLHLSKIRFF
jgi:hypothetical protein